MTDTRKAAWTAGPWSVHCSHIYAPDGAIIAQVHNPGSKESDYPLVANRDLMAAAPALAEALAGALGALEQDVDTGADMGDPEWVAIAQSRLDAARGALALARGETA